MCVCSFIVAKCILFDLFEIRSYYYVFRCISSTFVSEGNILLLDCLALKKEGCVFGRRVFHPGRSKF